MAWQIMGSSLLIPDEVWLNLFVAHYLRPPLLVPEGDRALLTMQPDYPADHRMVRDQLDAMRLPIVCLACLAILGEEDGGNIKLVCHKCRPISQDWGQRFLNIHVVYNRQYNQPGIAAVYLANLIHFQETGQRNYYAKHVG